METKALVTSVVHSFLNRQSAETSNGKQLSMGREVEKEHKDIFDLLNKAFEEAGAKMPVTEDQFYEMIAQGHLREFKDYYTRLKKMESTAEKEAMDFTSLGSVLKADEPLDPRETARAIRLAIAAEHDAAQFYELVADSCDNADVKELLQDLSDEEKVHVGELQQLLSVLDTKDEKLLEEGREEAKDVVG
jgi:rubrerythrin